MRTSLPLILAFSAVPVLASVPQDQSYLGIFVETRQFQIAGMKPHPMPNLPPGIKLPPSVAAMMEQKPKRVLNVRLWSPTIAPDNATATVTPPSGLGIDKMDLDIYRPSAAPTGAGGGGGEGAQGERKNMTIKIYWGSSPTVQPGQPKIFTTADMTPDQARALSGRMRGMNPMGGMGSGGASAGSYFYKEGWSTGYWPTQKEPGDISDTAALPGTYSLETNYVGNVSIDAPSNVDFLAPITMTSPDLGKRPNLADALAFQWNQIPNCLGQYATAFGMEQDSNTLILWSSAENYADAIMNDNGFLQMAEVQDMVQKHIFMDGNATNVTVPAGIFKAADFSMFNMVGYGPGTARDGVTPVPRIQTKTTFTCMLGGKKGGMGGGDDDGGGTR